MKVPHSEGVANHTDPLSCVGHREVSGEAWRCRPRSSAPHRAIHLHRCRLVRAYQSYLPDVENSPATVAANRLQWPPEPR